MKYSITDAFIDALLESDNKALNEKIEYITQKELDNIPDDYKCTVGDVVKTSEFRGENPKDTLKKYKKLGYDEKDPMVLSRDDKKGTVLEPKKLKKEAVYADGYIDDLPEKYPEEIRNEYYEYVNNVDMKEDPLDFIEWVEQNHLDLYKKLEKESKSSNKAHISEGKLQEKKKYWPAVWHSYEIDGTTFDFKCQYYEVSGSRQDSLWGHEVDFKVNGLTVTHAKISYYNRTWESFEFQSCMREALATYMDNVKNALFVKAREEKGTSRLTAKDKEELLAENNTYQQLVKLYDMINAGDRGIVEENKSITAKSEILKENDDENDENDDENNEDIFDNTISLLSRAYRDIPVVGVEDWGKDDEMNFLIDTRELITYLDEYEIEIPEYFVNNAPYDDFSNGVDDYLVEFKGINLEDGVSDNTYNWNAPLTHDIEYTKYITNDSVLIKASVHRDGDVRGNYTDEFLLEFDSEDDFHEIMYDICSQELYHTVQLGDNVYIIKPNFFAEYVDIYDENNPDNVWEDINCRDIAELKEIVGYKDTDNHLESNVTEDDTKNDTKNESKKIEEKHPTIFTFNRMLKMFNDIGLDTEYRETFAKGLVELGYIDDVPARLNDSRGKQKYRYVMNKKLDQEELNKMLTYIKDAMENDYQIAEFMEIYTSLSKYIVD